jgi:hypothetical protein
VAIGVLVGAYLLGGGHGASKAGPTASGSANGASIVPMGPVNPSTDSRASAIAWLRGYRSQSWTDPAAWSWTTRVSPVVTGELAAQYRAVRGAGGGAEWSGYVAGRCVTSITGPAAVIPEEAPRTADEVYVEVSGDAVTRCAVGQPPSGPGDRVSATLELTRVGQYWLVTRRIY